MNLMILSNALCPGENHPYSGTANRGFESPAAISKLETYAYAHVLHNTTHANVLNVVMPLGSRFCEKNSSIYR
jgi:hypothetical protein